MLHLFSLIFVSAILSKGNPAVAGDLTVKLKQEVAVESRTVLLQDIADLTGSDENAVKELSKRVIAASPEFGSVAVLNRHQVIKSLEDTGGLPGSTSVEGAPAVQIRLRGRAADHKEIAAAVKDHLARTTGWEEHEIEVGPIQNLNGIELPPGDVKLKLSSEPAITGQRRMLAAIDAFCDNKLIRSFWVTAEVRVRASVVTASRAIRRGSVITDDDIRVSLIEIPDPRLPYARGREDLIGKATRRDFSSGDPIAVHATKDPVLIKSGATVRLLLERSGIVLTSLARAEQDGVLGQVIKVRNLAFSTRIQGRVTGPSEVRVCE